MNTTEYKFEITREFDAPLDLMWKVNTEAEHMKKWFAGPGFDMTYCKIDLRVGGIMHYKQEGPNNMVLWGRFVFKEIDEPNKLVYLTSFSNANAEIAPNPFSEAWPAEILNTVTFTEKNGKTTVHIVSKANNATEEEVKAFIDMFGSMNEGYGVTLDKLSTYLETLV